MLAHLGIGQGEQGPQRDDGDALDLAQIEGVDALITGHTHLRFPGTDHRTRAGVDAARGTLAGRPAIMAGHAGSDLAIMDLTLKQGAKGWSITAHDSALAINAPHTSPDPAILRLSAGAHAETCSDLTQSLGKTSRALHNYFSLAAPTRTAALHAQAKINATRIALAQTPHAHLPLLATAAAHTAGGRGGPGYFLHVPAGTLRERHLVGLDPYNNSITAVLQSGKQLRARLEHSARVFVALQGGALDQPLKDAAIPSYDFDTIFGLHYKIDPTAPAGARVKDLRHQGQPVAEDQMFVLATNQFRVVGGGGFQIVPPHEVLLERPLHLRAALLALLQRPESEWNLEANPWTFTAARPMKAILETSPHAAHHLDEIAALSPKLLGESAKGFLQLRLTL